MEKSTKEKETKRKAYVKPALVLQGKLKGIVAAS